MLGRLARREKNLPEARQYTQAALQTYLNMDNRWNIALGYWDLADIERNDQNLKAARDYYRKALALLEAIGAPSASTVKAELEALSQDSKS